MVANNGIFCRRLPKLIYNWIVWNLDERRFRQALHFPVWRSLSTAPRPALHSKAKRRLYLGLGGLAVRGSGLSARLFRGFGRFRTSGLQSLEGVTHRPTSTKTGFLDPSNPGKQTLDLEKSCTQPNPNYEAPQPEAQK